MNRIQKVSATVLLALCISSSMTVGFSLFESHEEKHPYLIEEFLQITDAVKEKIPLGLKAKLQVASNKMFPTDAKASKNNAKLEQMAMGSATVPSDVILNSFLDLSINWGTQTDDQIWSSIATQLSASAIANSTLAPNIMLRELLAHNLLYASNDGTYSDPINVYNPLSFVGDPRDKQFLFRLNVRRSFFDLMDNAMKAPSFYAFYQMIQNISPKIQQLAAGQLSASNANLLTNMKTYMQYFTYMRDSNTLKALRRAFEDAENTLYPDSASFAYYALYHGGWKMAALPFHKIGNCPHNLPIFAPWHREQLRQLEVALQFHVPGLMMPYLDWLLVSDRGVPQYFLRPQVLGDYSDNTDDHINMIYQQVQGALASLEHIDAFLEVLTATPFVAADVQAAIITHGVPFSTKFFASTNTLLDANSIEMIATFVEVNIKGLVHNFVTSSFAAVNTVKHNPVYSAFNLGKNAETFRLGHDYTNEAEYQGSYKQNKIRNQNIDAGLSYVLHSSSYEQNFDNSNAMDNADNNGNTALAQMNLGFRSRLEGVHNFMHDYFGDYVPWTLKDLSWPDICEEIECSAMENTYMLLSDMSDVPSAAFDPIFWFHHTYVDYIYSEWQTMIQSYIIQVAASNKVTYSAYDLNNQEKKFYPSYFFDTPLQPVTYWPSAETSHANMKLYQRSPRLLKNLQMFNATVLSQGYIITVNNIPTNMMGQKFNVQIYAQAKTSTDQVYIGGVSQLPSNFNINPNMWSGMFMGLYPRSLYVPAKTLASLKTMCAVSSSGLFTLNVIFSMMDYPTVLTQFSNSDTMARSYMGSYYAAQTSQQNATQQFFIEPTNYWTNSLNTPITNDIYSEAYYWGSVLQRQQERDKYTSLLQRGPVQIYTNISRFSFVNSTSKALVTLTGFTTKFATFQFLKKQTVGILYRTIAAKSADVQVYVQANGAGEFSVNDFIVNGNQQVTFNTVGKMFNVFVAGADKTAAQPWIDLINSF